jgi:hypothetical protein
VESDDICTYPVVSTQGLISIFEAIERGEEVDLASVVAERSLDGLGVNGSINFIHLAEDLKAKAVIWADFVAKTKVISDAERNRFEATNSTEIYKGLEHLPTPILDDKDFWRWLIVGPLRWWVYACDSDKDNKISNESKGLGGDSNFRRNPVTRAYFRGRLASDLRDATIASAYGAAAAAKKGGSFADRDFIKSHILAVLVGNVPEVAGAFIRTSSDPYLPAGDLKTGEMGVRQYVKYFTRLRSEVAWTDYSEQDAAQLGRELRGRFDRSSTTTDEVE